MGYPRRIRALAEMPHIEFGPPEKGSGLPHLGVVDFRIERYPTLNPQQKQVLIRAFSQTGVLALYHGGGVGGSRWLFFSDGRGGKEELALATPAQISDPMIPRLPKDWEEYMVRFEDDEEEAPQAPAPQPQAPPPVPPQREGRGTTLYHEISRLRELLERDF